MTLPHEERVARAAFEAARRLEPTPDEIAAILTRVQAAGQSPPATVPRRALRVLAPALAATVVLLGGGYAAAPPVRAAMDDLASAFAGWVGGDDAAAPGRPLGAGESAPDYFRDPRFAQEPRVIAEAGGYKLFASRTVNGEMSFDLGNTGVGIGGTFAEDFDNSSLFVLGPGAMRYADRNGHVPLFGVTAKRVRSVLLEYEQGPPLRVDGVRGGFVLLAEPARSPRSVAALSAGGHVLARSRVDESGHRCPCIDWDRYRRPT